MCIKIKPLQIKDKGDFMLLHLLENAESSLLIGLDFYQKYLDEDLSHEEIEYYGNLKYAIIGIHNAAELFIKKLLSQVDDLLIYDVETIDNPDVLKYIGKKYRERRKIHLDYFMASFGDKYITLSFKKCLMRFQALFNVSDYDIEILNKLNNYRNILTHFGMEDVFGQDKMIFTMNGVLNIIRQKMFTLINVNRKLIEPYYDNLILEFLSKNQNGFYEIWDAANEYMIESYNRKIYEIVGHEGAFKDTLGEKYDYEYSREKLILHGEKKQIDLLIKDLPEKNISAIVFESNVLAIMDYDLYEEEEIFLFIPNKLIGIEKVMISKVCVWRNVNNHEFKRIPLNTQTFVKSIINKC